MITALPLALGIGTLGGCVFYWLHAPLAWLLGSLTFTMVACFMGAQPHVPPRMRLVMLSVIGVFLGSAFTPELLAQIHTWAPSVGLMAVFVCATTGIAFAYYRMVCGYDYKTAFFCSTPGGLSEMSLLGEENGADVRTISLCHAIRIMMAVIIVPLYFRYAEGLEIPPTVAAGTAISAIEPKEAFVLIMCVVIGLPLGIKINLPAAPMLMPLILSISAHLTGLATQSPPTELVVIAQIIIGTAIGCRFAGMDLSRVRTVLVQSAGAAVVMILFAILVSLTMADWMGIQSIALLLALAPGGLAEMSLIALTIGIETAYISTMHIVRIILVVLLSPFSFRAYEYVRGKRASGQ